MAIRSGYEAHYTVPGNKQTRRDVVLWDVDAEGRAAGYVINGGKLVMAESVAGFHRYEKQDPDPVIAALPGDGWWGPPSSLAPTVHRPPPRKSCAGPWTPTASCAPS